MENKNQKVSLIDRFKNMSRNKKIVSALAVLSFISIVFIVVVSSKKNTTTSVSPTNITTNVTETQLGPKIINGNDVYLLNRFDSLDEVIGYSWLENIIIYATKDGIYSLWQNKQIIRGPISQIQFSKNGNAVYSNSSGVYFADSALQYSKILDITDTKARISDTGNYILYTEGGNLIARKIEDDSNKSIAITQDRNTTTGWISDSDYIYFYNKGSSTVDVYNTDFQKIQSFKINKDQEFIGINSTLSLVATKSKENLYIKETKTDETTVYTFTSGSELTVNWIAQDKVFVTERVLRGIYDLYDQNFWIITASTKYKKFIADSTSMKNKANTSIEPLINKDSTVMLITENNGKIWTISLIPTRMVTYTEKGVTLFNLPNVTKGD